MVNIYIAEDDYDDFLLLKEGINEVLPKFNIKHTTNGKSFLDSIQNNEDIDLIFLDLNLPRKNGIDCLIELRQQKALDNVPVIIYSTSSDFEHIDRCYKNGCTLYLVKPSSYNHLVTQLKKIFFRIGLPRKDLQFKEMFVVQRQHE